MPQEVSAVVAIVLDIAGMQVVFQALGHIAASLQNNNFASL